MQRGLVRQAGLVVAAGGPAPRLCHLVGACSLLVQQPACHSSTHQPQRFATAGLVPACHPALHRTCLSPQARLVSQPRKRTPFLSPNAHTLIEARTWNHLALDSPSHASEVSMILRAFSWLKSCKQGTVTSDDSVVLVSEAELTRGCQAVARVQLVEELQTVIAQ